MYSILNYRNVVWKSNGGDWNWFQCFFAKGETYFSFFPSTWGSKNPPKVMSCWQKIPLPNDKPSAQLASWYANGSEADWHEHQSSYSLTNNGRPFYPFNEYKSVLKYELLQRTFQYSYKDRMSYGSGWWWAHNVLEKAFRCPRAPRRVQENEANHIVYAESHKYEMTARVEDPRYSLPRKRILRPWDDPRPGI